MPGFGPCGRPIVPSPTLPAAIVFWLPDITMRIYLCLLLSCLATVASANEEAMARFNYLMGDEAQRERAFEAGRERALFCSYCHGETGNSKRPHIPNLAGQNPLYLF